MTFESPPRLKHTAELGALLRAAEATPSPERLAENGAAIKAAVAAGTTIAAWKLLVPLVLLLGVGAVMWTLTRPSAAPAPAGAAPALEARVVVPDAGPAAGDAPPTDAASALALDTAPPDAAVAVTRPTPPRPPARAAAVVDAGVDAPPSELPAQIALYEEARAAGRRGELDRGIELVELLLVRFPATPLRAEAELTRAELLARAERLDAAAPALEALIADPQHRGRRGELLRTLGDLYRRHGDCARAIAAYDRALAAPLRERDRAEIERGRDRCTPR